MATNKVIYGNTTLIDLTSDTVTASDVASGKTFHAADGTIQTGTGGSGETGVLLWSNPNPDAAFDINGTIQLSNAFTNYSKIKWQYYNNNNGTSADVQELIVPVDVIPRASSATANGVFVANVPAMGCWASNYPVRVWAKEYNDDTKLRHYAVNGGTRFIPLAVYGIV